jgi:hypothetical protein
VERYFAAWRSWIISLGFLDVETWKEEKPMLPQDWTLPSRYPICPQADSFHRTAQDAIFRQLSGATSPEQFQAAQESLELLRAELEQQLPWSHYGLSVGTHRCVGDLYKEATARLRSLAVLQPAPPAPPAPGRRQPQRSSDEVVNDIASLADDVKRPEDTFLGEKRKEDTAPGGSR